jgi:nitrate reductase delta subunit
MEPVTSATYTALARALLYPAPGSLAALEGALAVMPGGPAKSAYGEFVGKLRGLKLGEWEELHTRTLDLNPPAAPYVGYQIWGDSYKRGGFLARLKRAFAAAGVNPAGELPDHLAPILSYLACAPGPLPELVEVLDPALKRMLAALRKAEPANPYVDLLEAVQAACQGFGKEDA